MYTLEEIKDYLDKAIRHWREQSKRTDIEANGHFYFMCECYIDAYQSVRKNIFGKMLDEN